MKKKILYVFFPVFVFVTVFTLGSHGNGLAKAYAKVIQTWKHVATVEEEEYIEVVYKNSYNATKTKAYTTLYGTDHESRFEEDHIAYYYVTFETKTKYNTVYTMVLTNVEVADDKEVPKEEPKEEPTPQNSYTNFTETFVQRVVDEATKNVGTKDEGKPVTIDAGPWISLKGNVVKDLMAKSKTDVTIVFTYQGNRYSFTIPKGAKLEDDAPYYGFLYLSELFGRKQLTFN